MQIKEKPIIIKLNPSFYSKGAILQTIKDFSSVCSSDLEKKSKFLITINPKKGIDKNELAHEFCNYCLGLMNQ